DPLLIFGKGMVYAAQGKKAEAQKIINELEQLSGAGFDQAHWIAKIYALLGEKEEALTWLKRGLDTGAIGSFYKDEPVWGAIRSDSRFTDLINQMGIPQ